MRVKTTIAIVFCTIIFNCELTNVASQDFSYDGSLGPEHWGEQYNSCDGKYQSPININDKDVVLKTYMDIELAGFDVVPETAQITNNGHTVSVRLSYENEMPTIEMGPLMGIYEFAQYHFHWGDNDTVGSEDRINNQSYPAELHMVFFNQEHNTFEKAVQQSNGIAVLAFFFTIQDEDNEKYADLTMLLDTVREPNSTKVFINPPTLKDIASDNFEKYFTYMGSLTTPPCSEDVTWIDFETPIKISAAQINRFRQIYSHDGNLLTHNFRPIQPLNGRTVYKSVPQSELTMDYNDLVPSQAIPYRNPKDGAQVLHGPSKYLTHSMIIICLILIPIKFQ